MTSQRKEDADAFRSPSQHNGAKRPASLDDHLASDHAEEALAVDTSVARWMLVVGGMGAGFVRALN
jgi:uncharacterized YccA/Bax inhibitor family protein